MNGGGAAIKRPKAGRRSIYCLPVERARIGERAEAAGMSFSGFMVACALHGEDDGDDERTGHRLALSEEEQRELHRRVELLDRCNEALLTRVPGIGMSMLAALAFLARARDGDR